MTYVTDWSGQSDPQSVGDDPFGAATGKKGHKIGNHPQRTEDQTARLLGES